MPFLSVYNSQSTNMKRRLVYLIFTCMYIAHMGCTFLEVCMFALTSPSCFNLQLMLNVLHRIEFCIKKYDVLESPISCRFVVCPIIMKVRNSILFVQLQS